MRRSIMLFSSLVFSLAVAAADGSPFNVLEQYSSIVTDVRYEADNVWIKLSAEHANDTIVVRISNSNRESYRPWFHGEMDLVSTGPRASGMWSDRVQTGANYIEYWLDDKLILHLERK